MEQQTEVFEDLFVETDETLAICWTCANVRTTWKPGDIPPKTTVRCDITKARVGLNNTGCFYYDHNDLFEA